MQYLHIHPKITIFAIWKEKLGNYLIDISKYLLTGVFVTSLVKDMGDFKWLVYISSALISALTLILGLILTNNKDKKS